MVAVSLLRCVWPFATPWTAACQASLNFTISQSLLKLVSIESVMPSNHLILYHFLLLLLPSVFPSIRVFFNESALCIRWAEYWSFSFTIILSNECSGLISFKIDQFDLLAVQGILKSLLQHCSSKASILWHIAFFMVQLSHLYMTGEGDGKPLRYSCLKRNMNSMKRQKVVYIISINMYIYRCLPNNLMR